MTWRAMAISTRPYPTARPYICRRARLYRAQNVHSLQPPEEQLQGRAVQVHPTSIQPTLKAPETKRPKLKYVRLLSILLQFCFNFASILLQFCFLLQLAPLHREESVSIGAPCSCLLLYTTAFGDERDSPPSPASGTGGAI